MRVLRSELPAVLWVAATVEIVLAESPSEVSVFLNGLLLTEGEDYSFADSTLTSSCLAARDFLVVKY